jgi:hypothetical protein
MVGDVTVERGLQVNDRAEPTALGAAPAKRGEECLDGAMSLRSNPFPSGARPLVAGAVEKGGLRARLCRKRDNGTLSREDFRFEPERDLYLCPRGNVLNVG